MIDRLKRIFKERYREIGLVLIAVIYSYSYFTTEGPFWGGKATTLSLLVLLPVALLGVMMNDVEKS